MSVPVNHDLLSIFGTGMMFNNSESQSLKHETWLQFRVTLELVGERPVIYNASGD